VQTFNFLADYVNKLKAGSRKLHPDTAFIFNADNLTKAFRFADQAFCSSCKHAPVSAKNQAFFNLQEHLITIFNIGK
jgi:hypothetical protein